MVPCNQHKSTFLLHGFLSAPSFFYENFYFDLKRLSFSIDFQEVFH